MRKVADWALKSAANSDRQPLILDVGTGTGMTDLPYDSTLQTRYPYVSINIKIYTLLTHPLMTAL